MNTSLQALDKFSPVKNLDAYVQSISAIPILSASEEQALADSLYYEEDVEAARKLVMSHLRFVVYVARSYSGYGLALGDLIQEGNVGLIKAVRRFDPKVGVRLVSFAVHWIKAEMHEFILRNWRIVKIATTKAQRKLFFNLRSKKKELAWLNNDETNAIAQDLGVDAKVVREMEGRLASRDLAFDVPVTAGDDETPSYAPSDYLEDKHADPAVQVETADWQEQSEQQLLMAMRQLDERSQNILTQRWLQEKKATLHELASQYGVSAERIRQLEKNAMQKIKSALQN